MDETLKQILSELQQLNKRVGGLESGQKELYQLYSGLEEHTKVTRNIVVKLSEDVDQLKGSVARLDSKIDGVEQRLDAKIDKQTGYILHKITEHDMEIYTLNTKVG